METDDTIGDCWVLLNPLNSFVFGGNKLHYRLVGRHENRSVEHRDTGAMG